MNDLSFVDRMDEILARRSHYAEVVHESLRIKLKHLHNDGEQAIERARDLIAAGGDASEELKEMEAFGHSLVLMVALLRKR